MPNMIGQLVTVIASGLAAFLSAWYGGKLGVKREAEKLANQRAFDRRLDWYERTIHGLNVFWVLHVRYVDAVLNRRPDVAKLYAEIEKVLPATTVALNEGILYGRPSTIEAFRAMVLELRWVMLAPEQGATIDAEEVRAGAKKISAALERATIALSREARDHLGLEELPPSSFVGLVPDSKIQSGSR